MGLLHSFENSGFNGFSSFKPFSGRNCFKLLSGAVSTGRTLDPNIGRPAAPLAQGIVPVITCLWPIHATCLPCPVSLA